jgi:nuclear-control-of-ATPase protein 2
VRRIDAQLDRFQLASHSLVPISPGFRTAANADPEAHARITRLQGLIKSLSTASSSKSLVFSSQLGALLEQSKDYSVFSTSSEVEDEQELYRQDLEWSFIGKATTQLYGLILNSLLDQILPLSTDIWYWDEVLGSYTYTGYYTLQTSPLRFWNWSKDVYWDAKERLEAIRSRETGQEVGISSQHSLSLSERWGQFYGLLRQSVDEHSVTDMQSRVMSGLTKARVEVRRNQKKLLKLREMSASGLGVLMDEALTFDNDDEGSTSSKASSGDRGKEEWKSIVAKSVALMETVLRNATTLETGVSEFEDLVFTGVEQDPEILQSETHIKSQPAVLAGKLQQILTLHMPNYSSAFKSLARQHGRPSKIVRYWIPTTVLILSSSTILRYAVRRKAEIVAWIRDIGTTTLDFWYNWVVSPTKKVLATIRHDKDSEIAIMSKESLQGDRASLERMVVDFAVDNPDTTNVGALSEVDVAAIRSKVREGDLTPVLKAYERDLRKPFMGALRGELVRALLIQVQKTKVDVEVAMGGIDALLKSQELVFGFVLLIFSLLMRFANLSQVCGSDAWNLGLLGRFEVARRQFQHAQG